jgi:hypothetical protein
MNTDAMAPEDWRAEIARLGLPHYIIAARMPIHPTQLSRWLWGREPMPITAKRRLAHVLEKERAARQEAATP